MTEPLAIYIHWPYCARICPYCDFNVYKNKAGPDLAGAIARDLEYWREQTGDRCVTSIHFGGGTPSLMTPKQVSGLIKSVKASWPAADDLEIGFEANPADADADKWQAFRDAGVTRLSLGVQSFNDDGLGFLGRDHDAASAASAIRAAVNIFPSTSIDLIFGWAGQSLEDWQSDIDTALSFGPQHISAYQLTIEPGTAFAKAEARGDLRAAETGLSADMYDLARAAFKCAGYEHYEVSNFTKDGHRSRHNMAYWLGHDYVGVGPGAHGRFTKNGVRYATEAAARPQDYAAQVLETGNGVAETTSLSASERAEEYVMMGLRIGEGISLTRFQSLAGESLNREAVQALISDRLLAQDKDRLFATTNGRLVLNAIIEALLVP